MIALLMTFVFVCGFGTGVAWALRWMDGIDIRQENKKLRKENEVLWARLKHEGKIEDL